MTYCSSCGAQILENSRYCPSCGMKIQMNTANSYVKEKDPILAIILSFLITGLGQVYVGKVLRGICLFLCCIPVVLVLVLSGAVIATAVPILGWVIVAIGCVAPFIVWLYGMYDANELAKEYNKYVNENGEKPW